MAVRTTIGVLMIVVALLFKESRTGLLLRAVRDDEVAAASGAPDAEGRG